MKRFPSAAMLIALLANPAPAADQVATWTNTGTGNWSTATNWATAPTVGLVPNNGNGGFTFDATIATGTATLDSNFAVQMFTLNSEFGGINGTGNLTTNELFTWTAGALGGTGTITANGGISLGTALEPFGTLSLDRAVINNGTATLYGFDITGRNLSLGATASWTNSSTATLILQGGAGISGDGTFHNLAGATIRKTGIGNSNVYASLQNAGLLRIETGTLILGQVGTNSGTMTIDSGAKLTFANHYTHTGQVNGAGTLELLSDATFAAGSTFAVTGPVLLGGGGLINFEANATFANLTVAFGTGSNTNGLGGAGNLTLNGPLVWSDGLIGGTGTFAANGTNSLLQSSSTRLARSLTATGTTTQDPGSNLNILGLKRWRNAAGSIYDMVSSDTLSPGIAGDGTFQIDSGATFRKKGPGTGVIRASLSNSGNIEVQAGSLSLGIGSSSGTIMVPAGTDLFFFLTDFNGPPTFLNTGTITGAGNLTFSQGLVTIGGIGSTFSLTGPVLIQGSGRAQFSTTTLSSLNVAANGDIGNDYNLITSAANPITVTGNFLWSAGRIDATVHALSGARLPQGGNRVLSQNGTINNYGFGGFQTSPDSLGLVGTWNNLSGSTFDLVGSSGIGGNGFFENRAGGLLRKTGGNESALYVQFNNQGTLRLEDGNVILGGNVSNITFSGIELTPGIFYTYANLNAGTWELNNNTFLGINMLNTSGAPANDDIPIFSITGTVRLLGPSANFLGINGLRSNFGTFEIAGGRNFDTANPDYITLRTNFLNTGTLIVGAGTTFTTQALTTAPGASFRGEGTIIVREDNINLAGMTLSSNGTLTLVAEEPVNDNRFVVTGTTSVAAITGGTIAFNKPIRVDGRLEMVTGSGFTGGAEMKNGSTLFGPGTVGGTVTAKGTTFHPFLTQTLTGALNVTEGANVIQFGNLAVVGPTTISGGTLTINLGSALSGPGPLTISGGQLVNRGTIEKAITVTGSSTLTGVYAGQFALANGVIAVVNGVTLQSGIDIFGTSGITIGNATVVGPITVQDNFDVGAGAGLLGEGDVDILANANVQVNGTLRGGGLTSVNGKINVSNGGSLETPVLVSTADSEISISGTATTIGNSSLGGIVNIAVGGAAFMPNVTFRQKLNLDGTITVQVAHAVSSKISLGTSGIFNGDLVMVPEGNTTGILAGSGTINGHATASKVDLQLGFSPGRMIATRFTIQSDVTMKAEVKDATGTFGVGYDRLTVTTVLTNEAPSTNPFKIQLISLDANNAPGNAVNFDPTQSYTWVFATAETVTGFTSQNTVLETAGFTNDLQGGSLSLVITPTTVGVQFTPVPEPATILGVAAAGMGLAGWVRRRRDLRIVPG